MYNNSVEEEKEKRERLENAKRLFKEKQCIFGKEHRETFSAMNELGSAYLGMGRLIAAIEVFQELHLRQKNYYGTQHPEARETEELLGRLHSLR